MYGTSECPHYYQPHTFFLLSLESKYPDDIVVQTIRHQVYQRQPLSHVFQAFATTRGRTMWSRITKEEVFRFLCITNDVLTSWWHE